LEENYKRLPCLPLKNKEVKKLKHRIRKKSKREIWLHYLASRGVGLGRLSIFILLVWPVQPRNSLRLNLPAYARESTRGKMRRWDVAKRNGLKKEAFTRPRWRGGGTLFHGS